MNPARFLTLLALLPLGCGLAGHGLAGELRGRVVFAGSPPAPAKVPVTIDQYLCGNEKSADDLQLSAAKEIRNAVVWIETPPPGAPLPPRTEKVELDQKGCTFVPRIVIVPVGGTVDFLNSDRLLHNIHATPKRNVSFNRTQPMGRTIRNFLHPGVRDAVNDVATAVVAVFADKAIALKPVQRGVHLTDVQRPGSTCTVLEFHTQLIAIPGLVLKQGKQTVPDGHEAPCYWGTGGGRPALTGCCGC